MLAPGVEQEACPGFDDAAQMQPIKQLAKAFGLTGQVGGKGVESVKIEGDGDASPVVRGGGDAGRRGLQLEEGGRVDEHDDHVLQGRLHAVPRVRAGHDDPTNDRVVGENKILPGESIQQPVAISDKAVSILRMRKYLRQE